MKKDKQNLFNSLWQLLAAVKFAVILLILIAVTSVIGTLIPQNGSDQMYMRVYGEFGYKILKGLQLDDMYHSLWYLGLLLLLCLNIVVCSIERLSSTYKVIFPKTISFNPDRFRSKKNIQAFDLDADTDSTVRACEAICKKHMKTVLIESTDSGKVFYAEKGRWTRFGVYIVHISILFLLIGAVIGGIYGFKGNMRLDPGQADDVVRIPKEQMAMKLGFQIKCEDFKVKFYESGMPEEFRSTLTIIENGQASLTRDIIVNQPLRYKGINIFQASYGMTSPEKAKFAVQSRESGMVFEIEAVKGKKVNLPEGAGTFLYNSFISNMDFQGHSLGEAFHVDIELTGQEPLHVNIPVKFPTFDKMRKGKYIISVMDFEPTYYTGLQITRDPGVWYVYVGFTLMILGCWITFLMSHQTLFIEVVHNGSNPTKVLISGTANKNKQSMKIKINKIIKNIKGIS
ncbi:MAG: cytochrome c biogenesis protein ResB [Desulfobacteraceae bacterium]|nr:MAG: cytochrome c biogenesis protein ResB [Desulfobacteraceae bacterium]